MLSRTDPYGPNFKLLGVIFDCRLFMDDAVRAVTAKVKWTLQMLLRSRRSFTTQDLVIQYKQQVLSCIEYRTGAIYQATTSVLRQLDRTLDRFLRELGITRKAALFDFHLAPLCMRRDIALLGLLHRAAIGEGPVQFRTHFKRRVGSLRMLDPLENKSASRLMRRSLWGLVRVYNTLGGTLQCQTVKDIQHYLQDRARRIVSKNLLQDWGALYSPRRVSSVGTVDIHPRSAQAQLHIL